MTLLAVMIGGAVGAPARLVLERLVATRLAQQFPLGTLVVNVSGSFVLGIVAGTTLHGLPRAAMTTGFLGAYTTFSTYAYEVVALRRAQRTATALAYLVGTVALSTAAAWAGLALAPDDLTRVS